MSADAAIYAKNLNDYCLKKGWISRKNPLRGSPSELVSRLGNTSSFWSDLLAGKKSFSSDLAREIEAGLGMPKYALAGDADDGANSQNAAELAVSLTNPVSQGDTAYHLSSLAEILAPLTRDMREAAVVLISGALADPRKVSSNAAALDGILRASSGADEATAPPGRQSTRDVVLGMKKTPHARPKSTTNRRKTGT